MCVWFCNEEAASLPTPASEPGQDAGHGRVVGQEVGDEHQQREHVVGAADDVDDGVVQLWVSQPGHWAGR